MAVTAIQQPIYCCQLHDRMLRDADLTLPLAELSPNFHGPELDVGTATRITDTTPLTVGATASAVAPRESLGTLDSRL